MRFDVLTVFPDLFGALAGYSLIERALAGGILSLFVHNLRDFTTDRHRSTDDYPFGGGPGMVMQAEPVLRALEQVTRDVSEPHLVLLGPAGQRFDQAKAAEWSHLPELCLICGHYEGVDDRLRQVIAEEVSLGDFVTLGGELPAMVMIDAVSRLLPDFVGNAESLDDESFAHGLLEYGQYTRPQSLEIPPVLVSGHHANVARYRLTDSLLRTLLYRPDLLEGRDWSKEERKILLELKKRIESFLPVP
jgi:tRNA (guanine37-N1)-methyltransferase